jgi:glycosyltransferase involved in cell wall biosynthesis
MNEKNIIFPLEFNHLTGGMILSLLSLIKFLSKQENFKVYVLASKNAEIFNLKLDILPVKLDSDWIVSFKNPLKTLRTYLQVRSKIKELKITENAFVITNDVGSEMIFSGFGLIPIKLSRIFVSRGGDYTGKIGFIIKKGFKSLKAIIVISNRQKKVVQNIGYPREKTTLIHNGVASKVTKKYKLNNNQEIRLGIIGYINSNKNQILAVKAIFELIKKGYSVKLFVYGVAYADSDKIYENSLLETINELKVNDHVVFKGFVSNQSQIYNNIDILLSCSLSEGFGRTIIEAMSYGIPCVGLSESGGLLDIIINGYNGLLIKNDTIELVNAIEKICSDSKFRGMVSENATATFNEKFTEEIMLQNYFNFLKKLN